MQSNYYAVTDIKLIHTANYFPVFILHYSVASGQNLEWAHSIEFCSVSEEVPSVVTECMCLRCNEPALKVVQGPSAQMEIHGWAL